MTVNPDKDKGVAFSTTCSLVSLYKKNKENWAIEKSLILNNMKAPT